MTESCICIDVDDPCVVLSEKVVTARKDHTCGECGGTVRPGEKYEDFRGLSDGTVVRYKTCLLCLSIRRDYFTCGWHYGMLREEFYEANGWDYIDGPQPDDRAEEDDPLFGAEEER